MLDRNFTGSSLRRAVRHNDIAFVNDYIRHHKDNSDALNNANDLGETALFLACVNNNLEIAKLLTENGANVNQAIKANGITPLMLACYNGYLDIVKCLLERGADIHQVTINEGATAYMLAAQNGHLQIMNTLFEKGANVDQVRTDNGCSALHCAVQKPNLLHVVTVLLEHRVNANLAQEIDGDTPLCIAAGNGHLEIVKALLNKGVKANLSKNNGVTPIFMAAQEGYLEVLQILLNHNADPNLTRIDGVTPFIAAAFAGKFETLKALLANISDINHGTSAPGDDNCTALFLAAQCGHEDIVKLLIAHPKINRVASLKSSKTLLEKFAMDYSAEIQKNIANFIAQQNDPSHIEVTPEQIAKLMGHTNVAMLIRNKGILPDECCCPISYVVMKDPIAVSSGITYERAALKAYYDRLGDNPVSFPCPVTGDSLKAAELDVKANVTIKKVINTSNLLLFSRVNSSGVTVNPGNNLRCRSL